MTCMFTGHRQIRLSDRDALPVRLEEVIQQMYNTGVRTFISGGALGFDLLAAELVLRLKREKFEDIRLKLMLPCENQAQKWNARDRAQYRRVVDAADEVVYVSREYHGLCMKMRNNAMVAESQHCIAYYYKDFGGTAYTIRRAAEMGLNLVLV